MNKILARWGVIYPVHLLRGEWVPYFRREIGRVDFLERAELESYQQDKLSLLLKRCSRYSPYFRDLLQELVSSGADLHRPASFFSDIPFLTKDLVRRYFAPKAPLFPRLDFRATSGSTGSPIEFFKDRLATAYMEAVQNHAYSWHGIELGEPQGRFWGLPGGGKGEVARLKDRLKNRTRFSAFDLSDGARRAFYSRLVRFRPSYFYGYPSLILDYARFLERERLSLSSVPIKAVIGTGEYMFPEEKEELERLLGVRCVSEYGCSEIGVIGFDCPAGKMHAMSSNVLVEVIDEQGRPLPAGKEGEIVVTELNATYLPFIRYRLGDRGRLETGTCSCGRNLPLLTISAGRKDDYITTPEGRRIYDAILAYTLKKGVVQFRALQDRVDRLRIEVVTDDQYSEALETLYARQLQEYLSPAMTIQFTRVNEIVREKSGKLRYFRSMLGEAVK